MIKTAMICFILEKCLDRLEKQIEYNLTAPEKRKVSNMDRFIEKWLGVTMDNFPTIRINIPQRRVFTEKEITPIVVYKERYYTDNPQVK